MMKGTIKTNTYKTEIPYTIILLRKKIEELNSELKSETDEDKINHLQFQLRQYSTELHLLEKIFIQSNIQDIGRTIEEVFDDIDNSVILLTTEKTIDKLSKGEDINE